MSIQVSNLGIVKDGLCYHINDMNPYCFRGENTINLFGPLESGSFPIQGTGEFSRELSGKFGSYDIKPTDYVYKYTLGNVGCHYHGYIFTSQNAKPYTFSFDYYISPSVTDFPTIDFLCDFEGGVFNYLTTNGVVDIGKWTSKYMTSTVSGSYMLALLYPGGCSSAYLATSGYILYKNPQVEQKSYPTPFVSGSRTNTVVGGGGLRDLTEFHNDVDLTGSVAKVTFNNGLYRNGVITDTGFYFSGSNALVNSSASNDHIDVSVTANNNLLHNLIKGSFTLEAWYYPYSNPATRLDPTQALHGIVMRPGYHSGLAWTGDTMVMYIWTEIAGIDGSTSRAPTAQMSGVTAINTWYHVVGTRDATNKILSVYVNGILGNIVDTDYSLDRTSALYTTSVPWKIGTAYDTVSAGTYSWKADGRISQVRMYNRALTPDEVMRNYQATKKTYGL